MRLSELVARCTGTDPELAVEDENGIPCPVVDIGLAWTLTSDGPKQIVLLEPANGED